MKTKDLSKIEKLLFFTKESLKQLEKNDNSLDSNLKHWLKKEIIISLKKGVFILKKTWEKEPNKDLYLEYLANKIYQPSYLSLEYVMNKYSLLTESVWGLSSITAKKTQTFNNKLAKFSYYSISSDLFCGYESKQFNSATILIAKKTKAVFDYLYLRFLKNAPVSQTAIKELRINWENISKTEFGQIQKYARKSKSLRVKQAINLIKKNYYA